MVIPAQFKEILNKTDAIDGQEIGKRSYYHSTIHLKIRF